MILKIPKEFIRMLASVPSARQVLTKDGLIYDQVRYRFNPRGTTDLLSNNYHKTPHRFRLKGTAKIYATIRCWEGDIDMIEMIDDETAESIPMWSTNPQYTGGLSRWEHHQYVEMMRKRKGPGQRDTRKEAQGAQNDFEREIMATKAKYLSDFDHKRPDMPLRASAIGTALAECEEHRQVVLQESDSPFEEAQKPEEPVAVAVFESQGELFDFATDPTHAEAPIGRVPAGDGREDAPRPPPQPSTRGGEKDRLPKAPDRPAGFGTCSTAGLTRPQGNVDENSDNSGPAGSKDERDASGSEVKTPNLWPRAE